jgi:integrase
MKLTDKAVRALQWKSGDREVSFDDDLGGFGIRRGRSWIAQFDFAGKTEKITLGSIEMLTAARARAMAKDIFAKVRLGQNPAAERRTARDEAGKTFGAQLTDYLQDKRANLKPRSYVEVARHLQTHLAPLHRRPIGAIDQRSVSILLRKITATSGPRASNNTRASGSGFFTWLMHEGIADTNPFANTNTAPQNGPRERCPNDVELARIWHACPDGEYGAVLRLLMLTGARRAEIGDLHWSEIDLDGALITLPAARTKGHRSHEIPLSAPALAILQARPRGRDYVFGGGNGGFADWSRAKRYLDARIGAMPEWHLHDLRRSMSTTMHERIGIAPHIVEDCLGHATFKQGVAGIYNKSSYRAEKRRALDLWATFLMDVVAS